MDERRQSPYVLGSRQRWTRSPGFLGGVHRGWPARPDRVESRTSKAKTVRQLLRRGGRGHRQSILLVTDVRRQHKHMAFCAFARVAVGWPASATDVWN